MDKVIDTSPARRAAGDTPERRRVYLALALFVACLLFDRLTYQFPGRLGITPFNPQAALAIALLMFCGMRYVPLVFLAAVVGDTVWQVVPRPPAAVVTASAVLTAGYAVAAALLVKRFRVSVELDTRRDVVRLIAVTLVCMLICGFAYVGVLIFWNVGEAGRFLIGAQRFFIGDSVGILIAAPLIFMTFSRQRRRQFAAFFRAREAWLLIAALTACGVWAFMQERSDHVRDFYLLFLPLVWAATRFGMVGAAITLALIQTGLLLLFHQTGYQPLSVFELQLLMIALAITGLLLGVTIDEQRRASDEVRESLKLAAAGEMAAAIAHELNQPLTALTGYARAGQLMAAAPAANRAQLADTMDKLMAESKRAAAVVQRLRDFFRSGATQLEPVALGDLADKVTRRLQTHAQAANLALTHYTAGNIPAVLMDTLQIEVVLRNLIMNALESAAESGAPEGGVEVRVETNPAGEAVVKVRDSGAGIRQADAERLFESFVTTKASGMGLGLALSRAIVDAHGGRLWVVPGSSGLVCFALPPARSGGAPT